MSVIKIAVIIYHNAINSVAEKTNITITRRETANRDYFMYSG